MYFIDRDSTYVAGSRLDRQALHACPGHGLALPICQFIT